MSEWGLKAARGQGHTVESISKQVQELQEKFPTAGASSMRDHLRLAHGMHVSRYILVHVPLLAH